ncbi:MAG: acetate--CoA ligase family protein [Cyclonatronaceae bacterium]
MNKDFAERIKDVEALFHPKSIAVLGANNVRGTVPSDIFENLIKTEFRGILYPVSPGEKSIGAVKAYKYVVDIEDPVDMAVVVFPSSVMHLALEQCGQKGIKSAIVISAGFREVGGKGIEREQKMLEIAEKYDISFIGPNCLGVINTDPEVMLNASFARQMPEEGSIGFLSQSGALCTAVLDYARAKHIGFSKFVSTGNKAQIGEVELLHYLKDDPKTKVVLLYLEEIRNGAELMEAARAVIEAGKPVLALKSGRSEEGAQAASSHTGSLAGSDDICDAAMRQAGIIRCRTIEEMFNRAIAFTYQPLPKSKRVAIVTNAGGPGVLTTDAAVDMGLEIARFEPETTKFLKKKLPATANIKNPIDVIGDARADRYDWAVSAVLEDPNVDGVFVILTPQSMTEIESIAEQLCVVAEKHDKPIYTSFMGEADVAAGINILQKHHIPHYVLPESMCDAFAVTSAFRQEPDEKPEPYAPLEDVDKEAAQLILDQAADIGQSWLPEDQAAKVLKAYGLPVYESAVAGTPEEAVKAAAQVGYPVVIKIVSDDIIHKSDVEGVVLDVDSPEAVGRECEAMLERIKKAQPDAKIKGFLIRKMIPKGEEVILGIKRDPTFGPVVMFGFGGIFVELLKDVSFGVAPVDPKTVDRMVTGLKASPLFTGLRGRTPRDMDSVRDCLRRLSQLAEDCPQIKELDINPLIVLEDGEGSFVADARIIL